MSTVRHCSLPSCIFVASLVCIVKVQACSTSGMHSALPHLSKPHSTDAPCASHRAIGCVACLQRSRQLASTGKKGRHTRSRTVSCVILHDILQRICHGPTQCACVNLQHTGLTCFGPTWAESQGSFYVWQQKLEGHGLEWTSSPALQAGSQGIALLAVVACCLRCRAHSKDGRRRASRDSVAGELGHIAAMLRVMC